MNLKLIGPVVFLLALTSFTDQPTALIGSWKIAESHLEKATRSIIQTTRKDRPDLADQMDENFPSMVEMVKSIVYTYKQDNTYEVETPQGIQKGKWELRNNGRSLWMAPDSRQPRLDSVLELSPTSLLIINRERGDTILYTPANK
jgi:hypothetical protein